MHTPVEGKTGVWITSERGIIEQIQDHFEAAFSSKDTEPNGELMGWLPTQFMAKMNSELERDVRRQN